MSGHLLLVAKSAEVPAMGRGEADAILQSVAQESGATCAAATNDGTPCQRRPTTGSKWCAAHGATKRARKVKVRKGQVQDSLNGTKMPREAGRLPDLSGRLLAGTGGTVPVMGPGQSAYAIPAERFMDQTAPAVPTIAESEVSLKESKMAKVKKSTKPTNDPQKAMRRLAKSAAKLPAHYPQRQAAEQLLLHCRLVKARGGVIAPDRVADINRATAAAQAAATGPATGPHDPEAQLGSVRDGTYQRQSLAGRQSAEALSRYTSPASSLGQVIKETAGDLVKAEAEFLQARREGSAADIARAGEAVTRARLAALHESAGR
jgi:hypothetical protein